MSAPASSSARPLRSLLLPACAIALLVAGIRLFLVAHWAGDAPYLDDWNCTGWLHIHAAEAAGGIPWAWLVYPQAEHLLVTQRFYSLGVAALNGQQWDVRAELMVATLAWGALAATLVAWGGREMRGWSLVLWAGCVVAAEAIPHAWENLLWAFQIQFLLLVAFSLLALRLLVTSAPFSLRWFAGAVSAILACLSQASGLVALLAAAGVTLVMLIREPGDRGKRAVAIGVLAALAVGAKLILPSAGSAADLHAPGIVTWIRAAASLLAWPWSGNAWLAILLWLPAAIFAFRAIFLEKQWSPTDAFWFALIVWSLAMIAASAWARGALLALGPPPSRYGDVLVVGLLANTFLVLRWMHPAEHPGPMRIAAAACWIGLAVIGIGVYAAHLDQFGTHASTINSFSRRDFTASRPIQAEAVRNYLRTRQPAVLEVQPPIYPVTVHLTELIARLQHARRWPATLDPEATRELPRLSRLARSSTTLAWGAILGGLLLGAIAVRRESSGAR